MIVHTHWLIANKIHEYFTLHYGDVLNRRYFAYGSIQPDISRRNHPTEHTIEGSLDFVVDQLDKYKFQPHDIENHSKHMGMISHYLSDFFCSRHYNTDFHESNGFFSHINYERKLHKTLKNLDFNGLLNLTEIMGWSHFAGNFHDLVKSLEEEYNKQPPSIENDILFALRAPLIVCGYLLRHNPVSELVECLAT